MITILPLAMAAAAFGISYSHTPFLRNSPTATGPNRIF